MWDYLGIEAGIHNYFIYQLVSRGIFGFLPSVLTFLILILALIEMIYFAESQIRLISTCLLASLIGGIIELNFYRGFFPELLAIEYGIVFGLYRIYSANTKVLTFLSREHNYL